MKVDAKRWWGATRRRPLAWAVIALAVAGALWLVWPDSKPAPQSRARQYLDFTACLLTDERGLTGLDAAPVWAGMQDASLSTRAKVQYVAVTGPQTTDNARTFLASLVQSRCRLVLAAGGVPVAAVRQEAPKYPQTRFVVVGGESSLANVTALPSVGVAEVRNGVAHALIGAVAKRRP